MVAPVSALASDGAGLWAGGVGGVAWSPAGGTWQPRIAHLPLAAIGALAWAGGWLFAGGAGGIARSSNGGRSWQFVETRGAPAPVTAFAVSPRFAEETTLLAATLDNGVLRSDDAGRTWEPASFGLLDREVTALAWGAGDQVLAGTAGGIYRSPNGGRAWRASAGGDGTAVAALAFLEDGTAVAATEDGGLLRSVDGGSRWAAHGDLPPGVMPMALLAAPPALLLGTARQGVLRSTDGGATWAAVAEGEVLALARRGEALYAGTTTGLRASIDGGVTWAAAPVPPVHDLRRLLIHDGAPLLAGRFSGVVRFEAGRGWIELENTPIPLTALYMGPDSTLWVAGPAGLHRSRDGGHTWEPVIGGEQGHLAHLTIGPGGIGWAGSADGSRLLHTRDGGVSWEAREAPFGVLPLAALQVVHTRDGSPPVLMAATYDPRLQVAQLWRTLDQGTSWERGRQVQTAWPVVATGAAPPLLTLGNLLFVERPDGSWAQMTITGTSGVRRVAGAGDALFALTTAGILRSRDRGLTWARDDAGLPVDQVMDIAVAGGEIYVLLAGGHVWSRPMANDQ